MIELFFCVLWLDLVHFKSMYVSHTQCSYFNIITQIINEFGVSPLGRCLTYCNFIKGTKLQCVLQREPTFCSLQKYQGLMAVFFVNDLI